MRNGRDTTLIDCAPTCLSSYYDEDFCARMADTLRQGGVKLAFGQTVRRIEGEGRVQRVVTDKGAIEADMVVFAIGFRANTKLGEGHLDLWRHGPYLVDRCQRTSDAAVFAIGDCATVYNNATRGTDYIALATNAVRTGIVAAHNACGTRLEGSRGAGLERHFHLGMEYVQHRPFAEKKARALGYDAAATDREDWQKASFIESGNYKTWLRVVYDRAPPAFWVPSWPAARMSLWACTCSRWLSSRAIPSTSSSCLIFSSCRISMRRTTISPWLPWAHNDACGTARPQTG